MGFGYHKDKLNTEEYEASRKIQSLGIFWGASMLEMYGINGSKGIDQMYIQLELSDNNLTLFSYPVVLKEG